MWYVVESYATLRAIVYNTDYVGLLQLAGGGGGGGSRPTPPPRSKVRVGGE